jgi:hypothetical protein
MAEERRPSGLGVTLLVGGTLVLMLIALVLTFVPLASCPSGWLESDIPYRRDYLCTKCDGSAQVCRYLE